MDRLQQISADLTTEIAHNEQNIAMQEKQLESARQSLQSAKDAKATIDEQIAKIVAPPVD